jgi:Trk-type K+ transport system membrane component
MSLLALTYVALTTACTAAYVWAGMTTFDAINHAMTTLATGGYSTHDASLGYFPEPAIHWVATSSCSPAACRCCCSPGPSRPAPSRCGTTTR